MVFTFFDFWDKKDRQLLAHCDQSTVSFSVFGFCVQFDKLEVVSLSSFLSLTN